MKDSINRTINYARISLTDLCNLRCFYCMGEEGIAKKHHKDMLSIEQFLTIIGALSQLGITKIRLTGGEPLLKKGLEDLLIGMEKYHIEQVAITTNGSYLLEYLPMLKKYGINNINVSIDSLNPQTYKEITRLGDLDKVISAVKKASEMGFNLKINSVLLKGINDNEVHDFAVFGAEYGALCRFIELMPFDCQHFDTKKYFISSRDIIDRYNLSINNDIISNNALYYNFFDGKVIGFISAISDNFCAKCNRIRITADGKLLNCLHENKEYDLMPYLGDEARLKQFIAQSILQKQPCHNLDKTQTQQRGMSEIGG